MTSTTAAVLHIGPSPLRTYVPSRNIISREISTAACGIDPAPTVFHVTCKTNTDEVHLRYVRRFNDYYALPTLLQENHTLIGVFHRADGRYCECVCSTDCIFEPTLINDALMIQGARYRNEIMQVVNQFLLPTPPNFMPHFHTHVTQGGRAIASFPSCARDPAPPDRRSAGNVNPERPSEETSSMGAQSSDGNCNLM